MAMGKKSNNTRKYPMANHQPRQKAAQRKLLADARQDIYNEQTLEQKIAALPPEPHSAKQRARLLSLLEKQNAPKTKVSEPVAGEVVVEIKAEKPTAKEKAARKYMRDSVAKE